MHLHAATLSVNFQLEGDTTGSSQNFGEYKGVTVPYTGLGAAPTTGTFWNQILATASTSATDFYSDGVTPSTISLTLSNSNASFNSPSSTGAATADSPTSQADLLQGWRKGTGTGIVGSFTLSGLTAGDTYAVYLYGVNGNFKGHGADFTIGSVSQNTSGSNGTTFTLGLNYVVFNNVVADSSGQITGTWAPKTGDVTNPEADFNALQVLALPEPGTLALIAVGSLMFLVSRRRRWIS